MKKLYIFTLITGFLCVQTTTHTSMALIIAAASQGNRIPTILNPNQSVEVTKHRGHNLQATDPSIVEISTPADKSDKHTFVGLKPGQTDIMEITSKNDVTKEKKVATIHVAYADLQDLPSTIHVGDTLYLKKSKHNDTLQQTKNQNHDDAGTIKIKTVKHNNQASFRLRATDSGTITLQNHNNAQKTITILDKNAQ